MSRALPPHAQQTEGSRARARRALPEPELATKRGWQAGIALLSVAVLGAAVAGSVTTAGGAQRPLSTPARATPALSAPALTARALAARARPAVSIFRAPGVRQPDAFMPSTSIGTSRGQARPALSELSARTRDTAQARQASLARQSRATTKRAAELVRERDRHRALAGNGQACLPVNSHRIAARFGATGPWARYHTGIDFSARSGTTVRAPRAGVVMHVGRGGRAGGWAGTYVTIRHPDGTSSLYAHMSRTSVSSGERVSAGQTIGRVGQTGRAFGPHLHFEIYPVGVTPGDIYRAVNPARWLARLGLHI